MRKNIRTRWARAAAVSAVLALAVASSALMSRSQAAERRAVGLAALTPLTSWEKTAPGIWRAKAGDVERELRYTRLAAGPPRLEALAKQRLGARYAGQS